MSVIRLENIQKTYPNGHVALHPLSLEMSAGAFWVLVGPSGCGKSTLLRLLAGLETPDQGHIYIGDRRANDISPADRDIAMVFQNYALYPHMTVFDNLAYGLRNRGVSGADIVTRVQAAAQVLQLSDLLQRKPRQLSGGQRQRVAMGRAIVREPTCFLFDEPLSNLDAKLRVDMRAEIRQLHQRLGRTTVYVTHDQSEAMTLADQVVVMKEGRIEQIGTPLAVYHQPASVFVAQFMGSPSMNVVEAEMTEGVIRAPDITVRVPGVTGSGPVWLGLRAEDVQELAADQAAPADGAALELEVRHVEELGHSRFVQARLGAVNWVVRVSPATDLSGGRVRVVAKPAHWHVFDRQTGRRWNDVQQRGL